jgi:ABC-type bacteriocin/lantibiotic exporter with double-glycine peptidase domain
VLLKLAGRDVRYSDILDNTGVDDQGMTLLGVKNELQRFGLAAEVIQCQPSDLPLIPTPYIIYTNPDSPGDLGHFDVVVSTDDKTLQVLDSITGLEKTYTLDRIRTNLRNARYFRDHIYLIVCPRDRSISPEIVLSLLSFTIFLCYAFQSYSQNMKIRGERIVHA